MNTDILRYVLAVADAGTVSDAAKMRGVSQPTVSLAVKRVEKEFGIRLFEKRGGRYTLTDQGDIFVGYARRIVELEDRLDTELVASSDAMSGKINLSTSNIPGEFILPSLIKEFRSRYSLLELKTNVMSSSRVFTELKDNRTEIGFTGCDYDSDDIVSEPFCSDTLVLIAPPSHPAARGRSIPAESLVSESFVLREKGSGTRKLMLSSLAEVGIRLENLTVAAELGSTSAVISAVESGAGISMASIWSIANHVKEKRLSIIKSKSIVAERMFCLVYKRGHQLSKPALAFMEFSLEKRGYLDRRAASLAKSIRKRPA